MARRFAVACLLASFLLTLTIGCGEKEPEPKKVEGSVFKRMNDQGKNTGAPKPGK